jgi:hypothetical protein
MQIAMNGHRQRIACADYGWSPLPQPHASRRLFFGAVISSEAPLVLELLAAEVGGIVDVIAFVESNTSTDGTPRSLRFAGDGPEFAWLQRIFSRHGSRLQIFVEQFDPPPFMHTLSTFERQTPMRDQIGRAWAAAGMSRSDVGLLGDPDETFTAPFMIALRDCDVPTFRPGGGCDAPKIVGNTLVFEGFLNCAWARQSPRTRHYCRSQASRRCCSSL